MEQNAHTIAEFIEVEYTDAKVYEILKLPECPYKLPAARSMTQASIDFNHIKSNVINWYNTISPTPTNGGKE